MTTRTIRADGIEIATEAFGNPAHPPVLLIMGAMASMLWWPEEFCERLAGQGRYVIRYDNRDTGLSTKYEPGEPPYTLDDMADDAIRVLDGYGIGAAHFVGMSLGGMIAQLAALKHPARVATVTAISTSPIGTDTSHLPQMTQAYMEHSAKADGMDWSDRAQVIGFMVADARALAGTAHPHDAAGAKDLIERDYDRSGGLEQRDEPFHAERRRCLAGPARRDARALARHPRHRRSAVSGGAWRSACPGSGRRKACPSRRRRP